MKKLIPALCMLLVAAALLGTSTFAWFSMSTQVTATGMQVKATATKNLLISLNSGSGYTSDISLAAMGNTQMNPVSTIGGDTAAPKFWKLLSAGDMSQSNYAMAANTTMQEAATNDYAKGTVYLKTVGSNGTKLTATVATTGTTKAIDKALRVMLVDKTGNKTYIFSPVDGAAYGTSGQAIASLDADKKGVKGDIKTAATSTTVLLATMTADTEYAFDVYAWYEGEDQSCTAANTIDMAAVSLGITFNIES